MLAAIARVASVIPSVVTMERQALGMATVSLEVEEQRDFDVSFADRVVKDEVATQLAIQLLDRVARRPIFDDTASTAPVLLVDE